ncbi:MAG TPA: TIGR04282 family arsenosugar biosynthesis glycosyltransferase [Candidatus Binatia bacterium]|nr:TIGR04282 family arsenosugar biosynthesis glycosyltransferase [Candidatus Binatia bacterium]
MPNALVIVAKAPVVGQVKTRLCPPLSAAEAAELFRCFLVDTVARACTVSDSQVCLAFTPADSEALFQALLPFPLRYLPQRGNGLGERLVNIFADLLDEGFGKVVIMDSDSPTLPTAYLQEAFTSLSDPGNDAVLGPCSDGGYYLVGARAVHHGLFENITWSTSSVLTETLAQARLHKLNITLLPSWYDIDNGADLYKLAAELGRLDGNDGVPRTRAFLSQLGLCSTERNLS